MEWFTLLEWLLSKRPEIKNVGENVEKTKFSYSIDGNVNWCNRYGKQGRFLKKFRTKLPYQGIYPKNMKTLVWKDRCTIIFIIALFTIAWKVDESRNNNMRIFRIWRRLSLEKQTRGWSQGTSDFIIRLLVLFVFNHVLLLLWLKIRLFRAYQQ